MIKPINPPILVILAIALIIIFGILQYNDLPKDAFPDISPVMVPIFAEGHGMAPEEIERLITYPIEKAMNGLPGVILVKSTSAFGMAVIYVYFRDDVDIYFARQLVNQRLVNAMPDLPDLEEAPILGPISSGLGEVFMYYLTIDSSIADLKGKDTGTYLREINDWQVKYQLQTISGVTEVLSMGGHVLQYQIQLNPLQMLNYDITLDDIVDAIHKNNRNVGGQFILSGSEEYLVRGIGLLENLDQIKTIPVKIINGVPVTVAELATVEFGNEVRRGSVSLNGEGEVVAGIVIKLFGENSSKVIDAIKEKLPSIIAALPVGVDLVPYYDQSALVANATSTVSRALMQGGFLIIIILTLFLWNLRTAFIVALALPTSVLVSVLLMSWQSVTANLMSLGGIAIAIGLLGDGSIVVVENIYRKLQKLKDPDTGSRLIAIQTGLNEVWRPIVFSVGIIIMVFLPIFALEGVEGKMFKPFAITIIFALVGSLLYAIVFAPAMANLLLRKKGTSDPIFIVRMKSGYRRLLSYLMDHKRLILVPVLIIFVGSMSLIPWLGTEFIPVLEEGSIQIIVTGAPSTSLEKMSATIHEMEQDVIAFSEVEQVISKIGRPEAGSHPHPVNFAALQISLAERSHWSHSSKNALIRSLDEKLSAYPGVQLNFTQPIQNLFDELLSGVRTQLAIKIYGEDLDTLRHYSQQVYDLIDGIPGLVDLGIEQSFGQPQYNIIPNREAAMRYGVSIEEIMEAIELAVGGESVSRIYQGTRQFDIHIRYQETFRNSVDMLESILIPRINGGLVPLREIAQIEITDGPVQINRENNQRRWTISANIRDRDMGNVVADIQEAIDNGIRLPVGYSLGIGGQFENQQRAMARLLIVIPIVLILIFILLNLALKSVRRASLIYVSIPLALAGGIIGLFASGEYLSVPAAVGFIAVFGIAVQNGLVLVDTFTRYQAVSPDLRNATLDGAVSRLRPVLMTALTTIFGLIPLLLSTSIGSEIQRPLAVVVVSGLLTSTILTLGLLPVLYVWTTTENLDVSITNQ